MAKRLFLLLFSAVMGITVMPDMLASADSFELAGADFRAVETVPLPEPEPEVVAVEAEAASYTVAASVPQQINYTVTAYSGEILADGLSYADIYKTGNLIYGHNSWNLLGNLGSLGVGSEFTVTEGGVARAYQVANVVLFEKNDGKLQLSGQGSFMKTVAGARLYGEQYDVAVMTCAGDLVRNEKGEIIPGDASHRLVVFANAI